MSSRGRIIGKGNNSKNILNAIVVICEDVSDNIYNKKNIY